MTLMRLMTVAWCSRAMGFIAGWRTPSMRYLITTSLSRVSMWMSEARRFRASKIVESTRRMIGRLVGLDLVDREDLVPFLVLPEELDLEGLGGLLEDPLGPLAPLEGLLDGRGGPHRGLDRGLENEAQLVHHRDVGGVRHHQHEALSLPAVGQEVVAEHQLDRNRLQDLGVGGEGGHVHELEPVAPGELPGGVLLRGRGEHPGRVVGHQLRVGHPLTSWPARPRSPGTSAGRRPAACRPR